MKISFIMPDGTVHTVEGRPGLTLMEIAVQNGISGIHAECGGACACATCHVHVGADWRDRLPPVSSIEEDMLDFAEGRAEGSRLACQIRLTDELGGLHVAIPVESL